MNRDQVVILLALRDRVAEERLTAHKAKGGEDDPGFDRGYDEALVWVRNAIEAMLERVVSA